jgi:hypothetical protein
MITKCTIRRRNKKLSQFTALLSNIRNPMSTTEIRELFGLGYKTCIEDTWLYKHKFIVKLEGRGIWKVKKP